LLRKPQVLIFDEATSALDSQSEDIINDAINRISADVTVIVIAHKPETVLRAKKVVVMEEGRIVAQGTHEELINNNEFYKNIMEDTYNEEREQAYS
jgi:ABC-type multidrug transport system fused ATPase/permease subunit